MTSDGFGGDFDDGVAVGVSGGASSSVGSNFGGFVGWGVEVGEFGVLAFVGGFFVVCFFFVVGAEGFGLRGGGGGLSWDFSGGFVEEDEVGDGGASNDEDEGDDENDGGFGRFFGGFGGSEGVLGDWRGGFGGGSGEDVRSSDWFWGGSRFGCGSWSRDGCGGWGWFRR